LTSSARLVKDGDGGAHWDEAGQADRADGSTFAPGKDERRVYGFIAKFGRGGPEALLSY